MAMLSGSDGCSRLTIDRPPRENADKTLSGLARDFVEGNRFIFTHAGLSFVFLAMAVAMFALSSFSPLISIFVRDELHARPFLFGVVSAMVGVGLIVSTTVMVKVDDLAGLPLGKRMLERVEQQLVHDQTARHGRVDAQKDLVADHGEVDARRLGRERLEEEIGERADEIAEVDLREIRRLVQLLVHEGHRGMRCCVSAKNWRASGFSIAPACRRSRLDVICRFFTRWWI